MYSSFKKHQIITESWRRFLFEEISGVEKHNIDFYTNEILNYPRMPKDLLDILKGINPSQVILKLQPLANNKIVKILGAGSFGITLELDNGHVLKLYNSRYSPKDGEPPPEDQFYKKSMDALYSGEGSRTTLPVFAQGTINLTDNNLNKRQLKFVEMGKLNAGVRWDNTNMDRIKQVISPYLIELRSRLQSYTDNFDKSTVKFFDKDFRSGRRDDVTEMLSKMGEQIKEGLTELGGIFTEDLAEKIVGSLISSITEMMMKHGVESLSDARSDNFSVDPTSPIYDPKFIFFDP